MRKAKNYQQSLIINSGGKRTRKFMRTAILNTNGERVTLTDETRDLGHGEQVKVIYSDGSEGYEHSADLTDELLTVEIKEEALREVLTAAVNEAFNFGWSGWRIPVFVEENGEISKGSWISQNSYQPDALELPVKIESWNVDYEDPSEEDLYNEVDERVDFIINKLNEGDKEIRSGIRFIIN